MTRRKKNEELNKIAAALNQSYAGDFGINDAEDDAMPSRAEVIDVTERLLEVLFPGFDHAGAYPGTRVLLGDIMRKLSDQIGRAMRRIKGDECDGCDLECSERSDNLTFELLNSLPDLRDVLRADVEAAYNGDPAARCYDEIILSYPGLKAIAIQRLAHVLFCAEVPLIPRMMTEYAHSETGIDIHPGATLGRGIFIDHGTGVVIGETAVLGDNVRIYQGVTLGAVSFPQNACGVLIKGLRRHPTIGSNVTIYSGASVLGDVTIGDDSVIGGNVWLTESLPQGTKITALPPEHRRKSLNGNK